MTEQPLEVLARRLEQTSDPRTVFGTDAAAQVAAYHRLARATHPDLHPDAVELAAHAFACLTALWSQRNGAVQRPQELVTRRRTYRLGPVVRTDDVAVTHSATCVERDGSAGAAHVRLPRSPHDNDLMAAEAAALRTLAASELPLHAFVPALLETFLSRDPRTGVERHATVVRPPGEGSWRDLSAVGADFPDGLDPRDVVWMWRRGLLVLGFAHRSGLVHGAPVPDNLLVEPEQHGLVLTSWTSSARLGEPLRAVPSAYHDWYPADVACAGVGPATDVRLLTRSMTGLMGERAPDALRAFARGCTSPSGRAGSTDAWQLLDELTELVERLYGPRRFRPFPAPTSVSA